jgi:CheY-like chemotaxis protein
MPYKNIVIIDDDEDDLELFINAVGEISTEINCLAFNDANQALRELLAAKVMADVIFLDLNMPVMNGFEFIVAAKESKQLQHIPIKILSTSSNPATIERTKNLGASGFHTKPDNFSVLREMLRGMLT